MIDWISVEDKAPEGVCLVWMEEPKFGSNIQAARYIGNVAIVGNMFYFDMPKVTHWAPQPKGPAE